MDFSKFTLISKYILTERFSIIEYCYDIAVIIAEISGGGYNGAIDSSEFPGIDNITAEELEQETLRLVTFTANCYP